MRCVELDVLKGVLGMQAAMAAKVSSETTAANSATLPLNPTKSSALQTPLAISGSGCGWATALATVFAVHMSCALLGLVLWTAHSRAAVSSPPWSAWLTALSGTWVSGPLLAAVTVCAAAAVAWWLLISPKQQQGQQQQHDADDSSQPADAARQPAHAAVTAVSRNEQVRLLGSIPLSDGSQTVAALEPSLWRLWRRGQAALECTGWQRIKACTCLSVILQVRYIVIYITFCAFSVTLNCGYVVAKMSGNQSLIQSIIMLPLSRHDSVTVCCCDILLGLMSLRRRVPFGSKEARLVHRAGLSLVQKGSELITHSNTAGNPEAACQSAV